jgi:hypothetical protein
MRRRTLVLALSVAAGSGCSSVPIELDREAAGRSAPAVAPAVSTGTVGLELSLSPSVSVSTVSYTLTGPGDYDQTGAINVSGSPAVTAMLGGIPAGSGYLMSLSAVSTDGSTFCSGMSSLFAIAATGSTPVPVQLACSMPAPDAGSIAVTATTSQCPTIDQVTVLPTTTMVGTAVSLLGSGRGPNPASLSYSWSASSGTFDNSFSQSPMFTCTAAGPVTITLTLTDGSDAAGCVAVQSVTVTCT